MLILGVLWRRLDGAHNLPLARAGSPPRDVCSSSAWVERMVPSIYSFTGVRIGAPLPFRSTTTNLAGSVLLALRPTT
jgi:hypothetical protein